MCHALSQLISAPVLYVAVSTTHVSEISSRRGSYVKPNENNLSLHLPQQNVFIRQYNNLSTYKTVPVCCAIPRKKGCILMVMYSKK